MRAAVGAFLLVMLCTSMVHGQEADGSDDKKEDKEEKKKKPNPSPYADARADDWFTLTTPAIDIDGYFRTRAELFHNFSLSRVDAPLLPGGSAPLWPQPTDNSFTDTNNQPHLTRLCGDPTTPEVCNNEIQAGANLRLRLEPSFHISDNLHIWSQIDMLDNIVLGSTPQGYANTPAGRDTSGYAVVARGGYAPIGAFAATQWTHVSNVNSVEDAVAVKRVWGSYVSPIGKIAFGRMPHHWGLGMLRNAGDGYDSDWQSTVDRLQFTYAFEDWNLYVSGAWDFANEGVSGSHGLQRTLPPEDAPLGGNATPLGSGVFEQGGVRYDLATKDDLDRWEFSIVHKIDEPVARYELAKGRPVINAGTLIAYTTQTLAHESTDAQSCVDQASVLTCTLGEGASIGNDPGATTPGFVRRGYEAVITDVWLQLLYGKLRFELEAAWHFGSLENTQRADDSDYNNLLDPANDGWAINQFGITTQTEWSALEERLRLRFGFGFASGDGDLASLTPASSPRLIVFARATADARPHLFDVPLPSRLPRRSDLVPQHPHAGAGGLLFQARGRIRLPARSCRAACGRRRIGDLVARQRAHPDAGPRARPRHGAQLQVLLPGQRRPPRHRRAGDGRLLHRARIRRAVPAAGAASSAR